jgi:hypothetical protein
VAAHPAARAQVEGSVRLRAEPSGGAPSACRCGNLSLQKNPAAGIFPCRAETPGGAVLNRPTRWRPHPEEHQNAWPCATWAAEETGFG